MTSPVTPQPSPAGQPDPAPASPIGQVFPVSAPPTGQAYAVPPVPPVPPVTASVQAQSQAPSQAQAPAISPTRRKAALLSVGGAALVLIGSFVPWASVDFVGPIYGTSGDGVITLVLALLAGALALPIGLGRGRGWMLGVAAALGLLAAGIAAADLANISGLASDEALISVGPGLPVIIVGGLVVLGGAIWGLSARRR